MSHLTALSAFALGGLLGGLLVGLLDATAGAGLGVLGIDALLGAALGALAGLLYPFIPPALHALALVRTFFARLRPGAHDALHDRCRTVTGLWILALGLPLVLFALQTIEPILLARVRSRLLAALSVALLGVALTGLALALAAPLLAGLSRAFETLVRRRPTLSALTRPDVHCLLALATGLGLWIRIGPAVPTLPLLALALLAAATFIGGELALRLRGRRLLVIVLPALALAAGVAWRPLTDPTARTALRETPALGALLRARAPAIAVSPDQPGP